MNIYDTDIHTYIHTYIYIHRLICVYYFICISIVCRVFLGMYVWCVCLCPSRTMPGFLRTTEIDTGSKAPPHGNLNGTNHASFSDKSNLVWKKWLGKLIWAGSCQFCWYIMVHPQSFRNGVVCCDRWLNHGPPAGYHLNMCWIQSHSMGFFV